MYTKSSTQKHLYRGHMNNQIKTVTILGGGAAGWLTALFLNKFLPKIKH